MGPSTVGVTRGSRRRESPAIRVYVKRGLQMKKKKKETKECYKREKEKKDNEKVK